jgi:hypothetical protein
MLDVEKLIWVLLTTLRSSIETVMKICKLYGA